MNKTQLLTIATVVAVDRITKHLIERRLPIYDSIDVIPGFFRLTHLENPGGAFGLFTASPSPWVTPMLIIFSTIALVVLVAMLWKNPQTNGTTIALSLILGGALGNLWDRAVRGEVTDFFDFYAGVHHWYPFNVADSAIVAGGLLLAWRVIFSPEGKNASSSHSEHSTG